MTNREIAINLRAIITENLCGPGGDPDDVNLAAAAIAFVTLEGMGEMDEGTREWERTLTGDNICNEDFLQRRLSYGQHPIVNPRNP